jgi:hypothetical protein
MSSNPEKSGFTTETEDDLNRFYPLKQLNGIGISKCPVKHLLKMRIGKEGITQERTQILEVLCPFFEPDTGKCKNGKLYKEPCSLDGLRSFVTDSTGKLKTQVTLKVKE